MMISKVELFRQAMGTVKVPTKFDRVYKDECMFSFDTPESSSGLYTSLTTWQSFGRDFVDQDFETHQNPLYLKQTWKRLIVKTEAENMTEDDSAKVPSKLAIGVEGGFDTDNKNYEKHVINSLVVLPHHVEITLPSNELPMVITNAVDAVLAHDGYNREAQVAQAWEEEERKESKYAKDLIQLDNGKKISPDPRQWRCEESGKTENLWLNLSTGYIGSGRKMWDGTGGTGAALTHYDETGRKYPLAVKLGTITPQGADVYSYAPDEDDMILDPYLSKHLSHWGINMQLQEKTEKTMTELQIDLNQSYQFDKITESGADLERLHGAGYVGLENLGNSCYMASVMQIMMSIPEIADRYLNQAVAIFKTAAGDPSEDLLAMTAKLASGLLSDKYVKPIPLYELSSDNNGNNLNSLKVASNLPADEDYGTIRPFMFKALIGKGHSEFSSSRQQDASEFLQHFLDKLTSAEKSGLRRLAQTEESNFVPTSALFNFEVEDRIEDQQSGKVKYITRSENVLSLGIDINAATNKAQFEEFEQTKKRQKVDGDSDLPPVQLQVPFHACVESFAATEAIENFKSPETGVNGTALKRTRIKTFPEYLVIHLRRYYLAEDWTPRKLDVSVPMPEEIDLSGLRGSGPAAGEVLMTEEESQTSDDQGSIVPDPEIVSKLMGMGFTENASKRAAIATNNQSKEASLEWVFVHMEDSNFNDPPEAQKSDTSNNASAIPTESILTVAAMGFTDSQAKAALIATNGALDAAVNWLFNHTDDLDNAVKQVEEEQAAKENEDLPNGAPMMIDGNPKYEILGFASHLGSNTSCGHYVAHIKKESRFVIYNDSKVAVSQNPPTDLGFVYVYQRKK